jgi:hypothetical protein
MMIKPHPEKLSTTLYLSELRKRWESLSESASKVSARSLLH